MSQTMEKKVEHTNGYLSYSVGILSLLFAIFMANAPAIMAVGGFIVLCMRLYVDGKRFLREVRRKDAANDD